MSDHLRRNNSKGNVETTDTTPHTEQDERHTAHSRPDEMGADVLGATRKRLLGAQDKVGI